jgi:Xaa-Pro aminopeptidase
LRKQRTIKNPFEIEEIKKAIQITANTFQRVLKFVKPGRFEFEVEAEIQHNFITNRSRGPAFQTIVASGADSCVLHYISNNKELKSGEHLLLDFGAEYANYNADITRCIPIGGKFSPRVKEVYSSVLNILNATTQLMVIGKDLETLSKETGQLMEAELLKLGLLKKEDIDAQTEKQPAYKKYFMHGVSHFLGLDVHDVGNRNHIFEEGMVLTCEPGIYIPEEKIGIRLENDILISKNGPLNLSSDIPIAIEEIEKLMS